MIGLVGGDGEGPTIFGQRLDVRSTVLLTITSLGVDREEAMQYFRAHPDQFLVPRSYNYYLLVTASSLAATNDDFWSWAKATYTDPLSGLLR